MNPSRAPLIALLASCALVGSAAYAFSPDGDSLLISSDATGVFNAYELPVAGGAPGR